MKSILKSIIFLYCFLGITIVFAQDAEKIVSITINGSGKSIEEAKQNALRGAIEQAFGAFVSTKTEILNDSLVKEEVVSISNGNIKKFDVLSELTTDNNEFLVTINAVVSISKLSSFIENKGYKVDFNGGLFAYNVTMQEFSEKNEVKVIENVSNLIDNISKNIFDFKISAKDPFNVKLDNGVDKWAIPVNIDIYINSNVQNIIKLLSNTLKSINMTDSDVENYRKLNKNFYNIFLGTDDYNYLFHLRNEKSLDVLSEIIFNICRHASDFRITNGIDDFSLLDYPKFIANFELASNLNLCLKMDENNKYYISNFFEINKTNNDTYYYGRGIEGPRYLYPFSNLYKPIENDRSYIELWNKTYDWQLGAPYYFSAENSLKIKKSLQNLSSFILKNMINEIKREGGKICKYCNDNFSYKAFVMTFAKIDIKNPVFQISYLDLKSTEQIKKISKFEIIPIRMKFSN